MSQMSERLGWFNRLSRRDAVALLLDACHSLRWAEAVAAGRPYPDLASLQARSSAVWRGLGPEDWHEAIAAHPRIGEAGGASPQLSATEQSGMAAAPDATRQAIAAGNREYEARFGYVFLIRAAGRTPVEVLTELTARLGNDPETEMAVAADQQAEITALRLSALLG